MPLILLTFQFEGTYILMPIPNGKTHSSVYHKLVQHDWLNKKTKAQKYQHQTNTKIHARTRTRTRHNSHYSRTLARCTMGAGIDLIKH